MRLAWGEPDPSPRPVETRPSGNVELLPCVHRGNHTGVTYPCHPPSKCRQREFQCKIHGFCTFGPSMSLCTKTCQGCTDRRPPDSYSFEMVAPLGAADLPHPWMGRCKTKPWHYQTTAIIPHLDTVESLQICVSLLRLQTMKPYIIVVDTGSPFPVCDVLEKMRADDLEIHYVRGNAYTNSSEPVCTALDLGFSRASTKYIFLTHTDVYMMRRDSLAWLHANLKNDIEATGWQMSDRSHVTDQWKGLLSHTFTALTTEMANRLPAVWRIGTARELAGIVSFATKGWPDTETAFGLLLRKHGIATLLLGEEPNGCRHTTRWFDHIRSHSSLQTYSRTTPAYARVARDYRLAIREAYERIRLWTNEDAPTDQA